MKKRLITSALPYVNNIPHLGNLIQVLSADVFARFCRQRGYETLYICGSDEYGTATETRAQQENISPQELCDRFYKIHKDIYEWFAVEFDHFGRTSCVRQTEIVQQIYREIEAGGFVHKRIIEQTFCENCERFLADRYVHGHCPHCAGSNARGDQCEDCGTILEPKDLLEPRCGTCGQRPQWRRSEHMFLDLPALKESLEAWLNLASARGRWAKNALQMTKSWLRDGLKERCITRDLRWGVSVPGLPGKVFYVWFDAPIGYIAITAELLQQRGQSSQAWRAWWQNPREVELFQFIGKDNIPFHTVLFPSSLLAAQIGKSDGRDWTMLHHLSSSEYLNYGSGKFSKTRGVGIFGNDCKDTGIPADCWRFYLYYNRPEKSDYEFTWSEFQQLLNHELIGNLGNLVNRTLSFLQRFFGGQLLAIKEVRQQKEIVSFLEELCRKQGELTEKLEWSQLKEALHCIMDMANYGNKVFQDKEPWVLVKNNAVLAHAWLTALVFLLHDLSICLRPYLPQTALKISSLLGLGDPCFSWQNLGSYKRLYTGKVLPKPQILFQRVEDEHIAALRQRFSSGQNSQSVSHCAANEATNKQRPKPNAVQLFSSELWAQSVELCVGRIVEIAAHPNAERLFVEKIDCGARGQRVIVSGLAEHYRPQELLGQNVVVVLNLKPVKLRGIESMGMILAASPPKNKGDKVDEKGKVDKGKKEHARGVNCRLVEVLHPPGAPGDRIIVQGFADAPAPSKIVSIDNFFAVPLYLQQGCAYLRDTSPDTDSGRELLVASAAGELKLRSRQLEHGEIG